MIRQKCLVCDSKEIVQVIDLGSHPFADTFVPEGKKSEADKVYPLVCNLCTECGHIQTKYETNPLDRYSSTDYSYTSSNSSFSRTHWEKFAKEVAERIGLKPNSLVFEIGSNDGYLIEQFLKQGNRVIGVDPSPYMAELAKKRNVDTIIGLFNKETTAKTLSEYGKPDLILANNVFNHADNLKEFITCVSEILNKGGNFVFEAPYWFDLLKNNKFDQIYHEHVSYFTIKSLKKLLDLAGMGIRDVQIIDYHGKSLRVTAQKKEDLTKEYENLYKMITEEENYGAFKIETYNKFMNTIKLQRSRFMQRIHKIKEEGFPIVGIAAAAKGNTFLNFYKLDSTIIDYVTDASPYKKGKYTPATRMPIVGDEIFSQYKGKVYALILTGNLPEKIKDILLSYNKEIEFIPIE